MPPLNPLRGALLTAGVNSGIATTSATQQQGARRISLRLKFRLAFHVAFFSVRLRRITRRNCKLTRHEIFMVKDVYGKILRNVGGNDQVAPTAANGTSSSAANDLIATSTSGTGGSGRSKNNTDPVAAITQLAEALGICDISADEATAVIQRLRGRSQQVKSSASIAILETLSSTIATFAPPPPPNRNLLTSTNSKEGGGGGKIHRSASFSMIIPSDINLANLVALMANNASGGGGLTSRSVDSENTSQLPTSRNNKSRPAMKPTGEIISEDLALRAIEHIKQMSVDKSNRDSHVPSGKQGNTATPFNLRRLELANQRVGIFTAGNSATNGPSVSLLPPTADRKTSMFATNKTLAGLQSGKKTNISSTQHNAHQMPNHLRPASPSSGANATTAAEIQQQVHLQRKSAEASQATFQLRGLFDMLVEETHQAHYSVGGGSLGAPKAGGATPGHTALFSVSIGDSTSLRNPVPPTRLGSAVHIRPKLPLIGSSTLIGSDNIASIKCVQRLLDGFGLQLDAYSWALRSIPIGELFPFGNFVSQRIKALWDRLHEQQAAGGNAKKRRQSVANAGAASQVSPNGATALLSRSSIADGMDDLESSFLHGTNFFSLSSVDWLTPAMIDDIPQELKKNSQTYEQLCGNVAPLFEEAASVYGVDPHIKRGGGKKHSIVTMAQPQLLGAIVASAPNNGYSSDNYAGEQTPSSSPAPAALMGTPVASPASPSGLRFSTYVPEKARLVIKSLSFDDAFISLQHFMALLEQLPTNAAQTLTTSAQNALLTKASTAVESQQRNRKLIFGNEPNSTGVSSHHSPGKIASKATRLNNIGTGGSKSAAIAEAAERLERRDEEEFLDSNGGGSGNHAVNVVSANSEQAEQFQLHKLLRRGSNANTAAATAHAGRNHHHSRRSGGNAESVSMSGIAINHPDTSAKKIDGLSAAAAAAAAAATDHRNDDEDDDEQHLLSEHSNHYSRKILLLSRKFSDPNLSSLGKRAQHAVESLEIMLDEKGKQSKANATSSTKDGNNINDEIDINKSFASAQKRSLRHNQTLHSKERGYNPAMAGRSLWKLNDHSAFGLDARTGKPIITRKGALFEASLMGRFNGTRRRNNQNKKKSAGGNDGESDEDEDYFDAEGRPISRNSRNSNPHRNVQSVVAQYIAGNNNSTGITNRSQSASHRMNKSAPTSEFAGNQFATINGMVIPTTMGLSNPQQVRAQSACSNKSRPPLAHLVPPGTVSRAYGSHSMIQQHYDEYNGDQSQGNTTQQTQPFRRPHTAGNTTSGSHRVDDIYLSSGNHHTSAANVNTANQNQSQGASRSLQLAAPSFDIKQPQSGLARRLRRQLPTPSIESLSGAPSFILPHSQRARIMSKHASSAVAMSSGEAPMHSETMSVAGAVLGVLENHKYFHTRNVPLL